MSTRIKLSIIILGLVVAGILILLFLSWRSLFPSPRSNLCPDETISSVNAGTIILWQQAAQYGIAFPPVTIGEVVVIVDRDVTAFKAFSGFKSTFEHNDTVRAYDQTTGKELWAIPLSAPGTPMQVIVKQTASDRYYAFITQNIGLGFEGHVVVINPTLGQIILDIKMEALDLVLGEQAVYVRDLNKNLRAYDMANGKLLWTTVSGVNSKLLYSDGFLYEVSGPKILAQYRSEDGAFLNFEEAVSWETNILDAPVDTAISVDDLAVAVKYRSGEVRLYNLKRPAYFSDDLHRLWTPVLGQNTLYTFDGQSRFFAFAETETQSFWLDKDIGAASSPIGYQGAVFFVVSDGTLMKFDPQADRFEPVLRSQSVRYYGNISGNYYDHYIPGISVLTDAIAVSFGCRTLLALKP